MTPESVFNTLSDPTRLRALMVIQSEGEVCVCELTYALQESQPKISRHLALMRDAGIVEARRDESRNPIHSREVENSVAVTFSSDHWLVGCRCGFIDVEQPSSY